MSCDLCNFVIGAVITFDGNAVCELCNSTFQIKREIKYIQHFSGLHIWRFTKNVYCAFCGEPLHKLQFPCSGGLPVRNWPQTAKKKQ